ncbi:MAG: hypothetical protein K2K77_00270, partial [Duncaniella sp.]|nr:hypothetical protein [Duncaniella sp.]
SNNLQPHDFDEDGNPVMRHGSKQFENRLFDRDTLIISHYDINFLYLIALYGRNNHSEQEDFRRRARNVFRNYIIRLLEKYYWFYQINLPPQELEGFVNSHFRELSGKLYHFNGTLIMALEKEHHATPGLIDKYRDFITEYKPVKDIG